MKNRVLKGKHINKGGPSGFVISLLFHAVAFFVAGLFVVFTVLPNKQPEFKAPPPVARPKMKLKKPKVKIKKSSQPKPSARIVAKVKTAKMPEIQIPDIMGAGNGLLAGLGAGGDFMDVPEIDTMSLMGSSQSIGNDFIGTYYDFNRTASGSFRGFHYRAYDDVIIKFVRSGWDTKVLDKYYKSPFKRYATCFMVPYIPSELGPEAFGEGGGMGWCWAMLYKGQLVHKDGIKFRFHGGSDDVLMVRVDGEMVLAANYPGNPIQQNCGWNSNKANPRTVIGGGIVGDWIELEPGIPKDMEVIIGEQPGGGFFAMLLVEVEGEEYELNNRGGRILPMFTTTEPSHEMMDTILEHLYRDGTEPNVTNVTTIFRDY